MTLQPCVVTSPTFMECKAPSLSSIEDLMVTFPLSVEIGLRMDGVSALLTLNTFLTIHENPRVDEFDSVLEFNQEVFILTISVSASSIITIFPSNSSRLLCSVSIIGTSYGIK